MYIIRRFTMDDFLLYLTNCYDAMENNSNKYKTVLDSDDKTGIEYYWYFYCPCIEVIENTWDINRIQDSDDENGSDFLFFLNIPCDEAKENKLDEHQILYSDYENDSDFLFFFDTHLDEGKKNTWDKNRILDSDDEKYFNFPLSIHARCREAIKKEWSENRILDSDDKHYIDSPLSLHIRCTQAVENKWDENRILDSEDKNCIDFPSSIQTSCAKATKNEWDEHRILYCNDKNGSDIPLISLAHDDVAKENTRNENVPSLHRRYIENGQKKLTKQHERIRCITSHKESLGSFLLNLLLCTLARKRIKTKQVSRWLYVPLLLVFAGTASSVDVKWDMKQHQSLFNSTVGVVCTINDFNRSCDNIRQWYGGNPYRFLCRNGSCRNPLKYREKQESSCTYVLEINDFSESDVDCEYGCAYGFVLDKHMLKLEENKFAFIPRKENDLHINTEKTEDALDVQIVISTVYPKPVCQFTFAGKQIKSSATVWKKENSRFYNATISTKYNYDQYGCSGNLRIECKLGSNNTFIDQSIHTTCVSKKDCTIEIITYVVLGLSTLVILALSAYVMKNFGKCIRKLIFKLYKKVWIQSGETNDVVAKKSSSKSIDMEKEKLKDENRDERQKELHSSVKHSFD